MTWNRGVGVVSEFREDWFFNAKSRRGNLSSEAPWIKEEFVVSCRA
jgi:hypothetical protein